jgi:hypothetical protein
VFRGSPKKKLTDAAVAWAHAKCGREDQTRPVRIDDDAQRQFAALGVTVEKTIEPDDEAFPIHRSNWISLRAFLGVETQWRVTATMSRLIWLGLDYSSVRVALDFEGLGADVFSDLRAMEAEALPVLNEDD